MMDQMKPIEGQSQSNEPYDRYCQAMDCLAKSSINLNLDMLVGAREEGLSEEFVDLVMECLLRTRHVLCADEFRTRWSSLSAKEVAELQLTFDRIIHPSEEFKRTVRELHRQLIPVRTTGSE